MNSVHLKGNIKKSKGGKSKNGVEWAWASVEVEHDGRKSSHTVKAFREPAKYLAVPNEGDAVEIKGHLERQKKQGEGDEWETVVIADEVTVTEQADIPF